MLRSRFSISVAKRLSTAAGRKGNSPGIVIGVIGVCLSFIVMLLSLSIVIGFKREIRGKVEGFESQLSLYPQASTSGYDTPVIRLDSAMRCAISSVAPGARIDGIFDHQALLKTDSAFAAVNLRCVEPDFNLDFIRNSITVGSIPQQGIESNCIVVSTVTADALGISQGDRVFTHFIGENGIVTRRYTVSAIYDTHFHDYDRNIAFAPIATARDIASPDSLAYTSVGVSGLPDDAVIPVKDALQTEFFNRAIDSGADQFTIPVVDDIYRRAALYFNWLDLLDTNVVVIILLMTIVSGFTLVSCLFILILERINFIGVLKSMGCRDSQIRSIFILLTEKIVIRGLIWGNLIGVAIIVAQHYLRIIPLDPNSYYLNYVPTAIDIPVWLLLNVAVVIVAFAILVLPAMIISSISPVDSMKYNDGVTR